MADKNKIDDDLQPLIKKILGLEYLTRKKLDAYSADLYTLRDLCMNKKKASVLNLGWELPEDIPFFPEHEAFQASTSGSKYNRNLIIEGAPMFEYDFSEAYTNIMRNYALPSNTYLKNVSYDREKIEKRFAEYSPKLPYKNLKTFAFLKVKITAIPKNETYYDIGGMFNRYNKAYTGIHTLSEIELKLLYDFYEIKELEVLESYVFRNRSGLLDDFLERIEPLKHDERTLKLYKQMRNKVYGIIGKLTLKESEQKTFKHPIYNRAYSAMVAGVFRDTMVRYEQKYVNSEYGLVMIKTDGIYFRNEVPEFENLYQKGIVKKKVHVITEYDLRG